ncbi:MAG: hypothetical protein M3R04_07290 [bacterium]|nr:hypothetical protein [bacterium]
MRKLIIAAPLLALSACAALPAVSVVADLITKPGVVAQGDKVVLEGKRAFLLAVNAYQGAANALAPVVASKRLDAATVNQIEALNERAHTLIGKGEDGIELADSTAGLFAIADEFSAIAGK